MKFLCLSTDDPEKLRIPPTPEQFAAIGAFMMEAAQSGHIYLTGGVRPSEASIRISYEGGKPTVTDGPYAEAKELVAGFAIIDVESRDEVIHWVTRFAEAAGVENMEIRELFLQEDMAALQDRERIPMRFLMLRSGDPSGDGRPNDGFAQALRAYEDDLRAAGVVLAAEGLRPSRTGTRLRFDGSAGSVSGFYILQLRSWGDALEWARRCPVAEALPDGQRAGIEIREIDEDARW